MKALFGVLFLVSIQPVELLHKVSDVTSKQERELRHDFSSSTLDTNAKQDIVKRGRKNQRLSNELVDWDSWYNNLKENNKDDDNLWKMTEDRKENYYPKELAEKVARDEAISEEEEDKFENEFGYKGGKEITVVDLVHVINQGNDVSDVVEGDLKRTVPLFNYLKEKGGEESTGSRTKPSRKRKGGRISNNIWDREEMLNDAWDRRKRDAKRDRVYLWLDRTVPYEIDDNLMPSKDLIQSAMKEIETKSCIRFEEYSQNTKAKNWIKFVRKTGCWSSVGRSFWISGFQEISLGRNCLYKGIVIHEIMHALGFWHEQSRPDRDKYVEIFWENISEGNANNFDRYGHAQSDILKAPYDYSSILHYGKYSFALDSEKATIDIPGNVKPAKLGQRNTLSDIDVFQLNELYDCSNGGDGWSHWSSFSPCDAMCYKERSRYCMNKHDVTACENPTSRQLVNLGVDLSRILCTKAECYAPVNGHWNKWGSWGECSVTCGEGIHIRKRECTDPPPKNGGSSCDGSDSQSRMCKQISCHAGVYDCTFDIETKPTCSWKHDTNADFQWKWNTGKTPSSSTGPSSDHTSGSGHYMFIETSSPTKSGWKARLVGPNMSPIARCMTLAFHMYGQSIGTLEVAVTNVVTHDKQVVFTKSGNQLNEWRTESFDIHAQNSYRVEISASKANGFQGDIAIDDIIIVDHKCGEEIAKTTPAPSKKTVQRVGCYHDYGYVNGKRPFNMKKNFRNQIKWSIYMTSLQEIVFECSAVARKNGYKYFAIQYWGECWTGPEDQINFGRDGKSAGCFPDISLNKGPYLVGKSNANMVYMWD